MNTLTLLSNPVHIYIEDIWGSRRAKNLVDFYLTTTTARPI